MMNNIIFQSPGFLFINGMKNYFLTVSSGKVDVDNNKIQSFNLSDKAKTFLGILAKCYSGSIHNFVGPNTIFNMKWIEITGTDGAAGWNYLNNLQMFLKKEKQLLENDEDLSFVLLELASKFPDKIFVDNDISKGLNSNQYCCRKYIGIVDYLDQDSRWQLYYDNSVGSHMYKIKKILKTRDEKYLSWLVDIIQNYNPVTLKDSSFLRKLRHFTKQIGGFINLGFDISDVLKAYKKTEAGKQDNMIKFVNKEGEEVEEGDRRGKPVIVDFKEWWSCISDNIMACDSNLGTKNVYKLCRFGKFHTLGLTKEEIDAVKANNKTGFPALKELSLNLMSMIANLGMAGFDDLFEINPGDILPKEVLEDNNFVKDVIKKLLVESNNHTRNGLTKIYVWLSRNEKFKGELKALELKDKEKILDNALTECSGNVGLIRIHVFADNFAKLLDMFKDDKDGYIDLKENHNIFEASAGSSPINTKNPQHMLQNLTIKHLLLLLEDFNTESKKNENPEKAFKGWLLAETIFSLKPLRFYDGNKNFGAAENPQVKMSVEDFKNLVNLNEKFFRDKENNQVYMDYLFSSKDALLRFLGAFEDANQQTFMPKDFLKFIIGKIKPGSLYASETKTILDTIKSKAGALDFSDNVEDREILFELMTKFKSMDKALFEGLGFSKDSRLKISLDDVDKYFYDARFKFPIEVLDGELLELKFGENSNHSKREDDAFNFIAKICPSALYGDPVLCSKKIFNDEKLYICTFRDVASSALYRLAGEKSVNVNAEEFKKAYYGELKDSLGGSDDVFWSKYQAVKKIIDDEIEKQKKAAEAQKKAAEAQKKAAEAKKKNKAKNKKLCDEVTAKLNSVSELYDVNSEKQKSVESKRNEIDEKNETEKKNLSFDERMLLFALSSIRATELSVFSEARNTVTKHKNEIDSINKELDQEEYKAQVNGIRIKFDNAISNYEILVDVIEKLALSPYSVAEFFVAETRTIDRDQDSNMYKKLISDVEKKYEAFVSFVKDIKDEAKAKAYDNLQNLADSFIKKANVLSEGKKEGEVNRFPDLQSYIYDLKKMKTEFKETAKVQEKKINTIKLIKSVERSMSENKQLNDENKKKEIIGLLSEAGDISLGSNKEDQKKALEKLEQVEKKLDSEVQNSTSDNVKDRFNETKKNIKLETAQRDKQEKEKEKQEKAVAQMIEKQEKAKKDANEKNEKENVLQLNAFYKEITKLGSKKEYSNDVAGSYFVKLKMAASKLEKSLNPEFYKSKLESLELDFIAKINIYYEKDKMVQKYVSVVTKMGVEAEKIGLEWDGYVEKIKALAEDEGKALSNIKSESENIIAKIENKITEEQNKLAQAKDEAEKKKAEEAKKALEKIKDEEKKRKEAEEKANQEMLTKQKKERDDKLLDFKKQTTWLKKEYSENGSSELIDAADKKAGAISCSDLVSLFMIDFEYGSILRKLKEDLENLKKKSAETNKINKLFDEAESKIVAVTGKYKNSDYEKNINDAANRARNKINELKNKTDRFWIETDISNVISEFMSEVDNVEKEKSKNEFVKAKADILAEIDKLIEDNKLDKDNNPAKEYLETVKKYKEYDFYSVQDCIDLVKKAKYELLTGENEKKNKQTFNSLLDEQKNNDIFKTLNADDKYKLPTELYKFLIEVCKAEAKINEGKAKYPGKDGNQESNKEKLKYEKFGLYDDDQLEKFKDSTVYKSLFDNLENDETLKEDVYSVYSAEIELVKVYATRFKKIYNVQKEFEEFKTKVKKTENNDMAPELVETISAKIDEIINELYTPHFVGVNNAKPEHNFDEDMSKRKYNLLKKEYESGLKSAKEYNKIVNTKTLNDLKKSLSDEEKWELHSLFYDFESYIEVVPSKFFDKIKILDNVVPNMRALNEYLSEIQVLKSDSIIGHDVEKLLDLDENKKALSDLGKTDIQKEPTSDYKNKLNTLKSKLKGPLDKLKDKKSCHSEFKEMVEKLNELAKYSEFVLALLYGGSLYGEYDAVKKILEGDNFEKASFDKAFAEFEIKCKEIMTKLEKRKKIFNREVNVLVNDAAFKTHIKTEDYTINQLREIKGGLEYLKNQYEYLFKQLIYHSKLQDAFGEKLKSYFLLRSKLLNLDELSGEIENRLNDLRKSAEDNNIDPEAYKKLLDAFEEELDKYKKDKGIQDDWNSKRKKFDNFVDKAKKSLQYSKYEHYFDYDGAFGVSKKELEELLNGKDPKFDSKFDEFKTKVNQAVKEVENIESENRQKVSKNFDKDTGLYKDIVYKDNGKGLRELDSAYSWEIGHLSKPDYLRNQEKFDEEFANAMKKVEEARNNLPPEQKNKLEENKKKLDAFSKLEEKYKNPTDEQKKIFDELKKQIDTITLEDFKKKIEEAKKKLDELGKQNNVREKNFNSLNQFKIEYGIIIYVNGKDGEIKQDYRQFIDDLNKDDCLKNQAEFDKKLNELKKKVEEARNNLPPEQKNKLEENKKKLDAFSKLEEKYKNPTDEQKKIFDELKKQIDTMTLEDFKKKIEEAKNKLGEPESANDDIDLDDIEKIEEEYKKLEPGKIEEYEEAFGDIFDLMIFESKDDEEKKKLREAKANFKDKKIDDKDKKEFMGRIVMLAKKLDLKIAQDGGDNKDKEQEKVAKLLGVTKDELKELAKPKNIFELIKKCSEAISNSKGKKIGLAVGSGISGALMLAAIAFIVVGGASVLPVAVPFFVYFMPVCILALSSGGLAAGAVVESKNETTMKKQIQGPIFKFLSLRGRSIIPKVYQQTEEKKTEEKKGEGPQIG